MNVIAAAEGEGDVLFDLAWQVLIKFLVPVVVVGLVVLVVMALLGVTLGGLLERRRTRHDGHDEA